MNRDHKIDAMQRNELHRHNNNYCFKEKKEKNQNKTKQKANQHPFVGFRAINPTSIGHEAILNEDIASKHGQRQRINKYYGTMNGYIARTAVIRRHYIIFIFFFLNEITERKKN